MIDAGISGCEADINGDGLPDIVMGGFSFAEGTVTRLPFMVFLMKDQRSNLSFGQRIISR
jgi:hypothetical protein